MFTTSECETSTNFVYDKLFPIQGYEIDDIFNTCVEQEELKVFHKQKKKHMKLYIRCWPNQELAPRSLYRNRSTFLMFDKLSVHASIRYRGKKQAIIFLLAKNMDSVVRTKRWNILVPHFVPYAKGDIRDFFVALAKQESIENSLSQRSPTTDSDEL